VPKKNFGLGRGKITEDWRELREDAFHGQYCSPKIVEIIKQKRTH
jgi:hypothetical protein